MVRAGWFWASLLFTVALSSSPQPRIVVTFPPPHTVLLQAHCAAQLAIEVRDYPASMGVPRVQVFNDTHVWATVSDLVAHVPSRVPCGEVVVHALLLGPDDEELDEVTHVFTVKDTETAQQEQQSLCSGGGTCVNPFRVAWIASPVVNSPNYRARVHIETQNSVSQGSSVVVKLGDWSTVEDLTTETIRADGRPLQEAVDGVAWAVTREYYNTIHVPHALPDGDHEGQVELWLGDLLVGKAPLFLTLLPGSGNTSAVPGGRANQDMVQRLVPRWQSGTVAMGTTTGESCRVAPAPPASPFLVDNYNLNKFYSQGIPRLPQHVYLPRFGTCALVSSNGNIKGSGLGAEIDGHDAVWRVNEAPAGGELGEDAGFRTTVRVMSPMMRMMSQLSAMHEGEHIVIPPGLWWNEPAQYPSWWEMDFWKWFHDKYKGEVNAPGQPTLIRPKHEFQIWAAKVKAVLGMGLGEYDWFDEQPEREIDNLRALGVQISSGWYSVLLATMLCENVTLFEYLPSLREDSHASCHYYKDTPPCRGQGKHCGPCERRALAQLSSTPKQQIRNTGVAQIDKDKRDALLGGGFTSCSPVDREWLSTTCTHDRCSELLG